MKTKRDIYQTKPDIEIDIPTTDTVLNIEKDSAAYNKYFKGPASKDILTKEEELELGKRIKAGDKSAEDTLVEANLRLVASIARKYIGRGIDFEDLLQEGNMGLITAAKRYDCSMDNRFATYAAWWVKKFITQYIADHSRSIKIPTRTLEHLAKIKVVMNNFENENGRAPTIEEIMDITKYSRKIVTEALENEFDVLSLDKTTRIGDGDDETSLENFVDNNSPTPEKIMEDQELTNTIDRIVKELPERDREIIRMRFGMDSDGPYSLQQVGERLGITKERVRQVEKTVLKSIRNNPKYYKALYDFLYE